MRSRTWATSTSESLFQLYEDASPARRPTCAATGSRRRAADRGAGECHAPACLATQGIRAARTRRCCSGFKETGDIFFAESDRDWVLDSEARPRSHGRIRRGVVQTRTRILDGEPRRRDSITLSPGLGRHCQTPTLRESSPAASWARRRSVLSRFHDAAATEGLGRPNIHARPWPCDVLRPSPNPHGRPNSDVVVLISERHGRHSPDRARCGSLDFGAKTTMEAAVDVTKRPFNTSKARVRPERETNKRQAYREHWWIHVEARPAIREAVHGHCSLLGNALVREASRVLAGISRCRLCRIPRCYRVRRMTPTPIFGVLQSRVHRAGLWRRVVRHAIAQAGDGFRYTPTTCFETFPFP